MAAWRTRLKEIGHRVTVETRYVTGDITRPGHADAVASRRQSPLSQSLQSQEYIPIRYHVNRCVYKFE